MNQENDTRKITLSASQLAPQAGKVFDVYPIKNKKK